MIRCILATLLLGLLLAGCAPALSTVPVRGGELDLALLAGEWEGTYWSSDTGRSGSILFRIAAGVDTASGDVVLVPRGYGQAAWPADDRLTERGAVPAQLPQVLTITFVRVAHSQVSGTLDPYPDPDCGCTLATTFTGVVRGDVIEGTFISEAAPPHDTSTGRWQARRKRTVQE